MPFKDLQALLSKHGMIEEVAAATGISRQAIGKIKRDLTHPPDWTLRYIALKMGMPEESFLDSPTSDALVQMSKRMIIGVVEGDVSDADAAQISNAMEAVGRSMLSVLESRTGSHISGIRVRTDSTGENN